MALSTAVFADPFFTEMDRAMNRFIHNAMNSSLTNTAAGNARTATHTSPVLPMDITETSTAYQLHADTPGMSPEDVKVELHEGVLMISGERKVSHPPTTTTVATTICSGPSSSGTHKVWRSERASYSFTRAFTLPDNANADKICATIDKGVLTVTVPKKDPPAKPEPKRITVTSTA